MASIPTDQDKSSPADQEKPVFTVISPTTATPKPAADSPDALSQTSIASTSWGAVIDKAMEGDDGPEPSESKALRSKGSSVWFRKAKAITRPDTPEPFTPHVDDIVDDMERGAPTDGFRDPKLHRSASHVELCRRKSLYYNDVFAVREPVNSPRNRVNQDAVIVIDIIVNVGVDEHLPLVSELSNRFAVAFNRPETSVMVILHSNATIMIGASFEPAYRLEVSALPGLLAPVTNLRHTLLLQQAMGEAMKIASSRGVVIFHPIAEENLGTNGRTFKDEISQLSRNGSTRGDGLIKTLSRSMSRRTRPKLPRINTAPFTPATPAGPYGRPFEHTYSQPLEPISSTIDEEEAVPVEGGEQAPAPKKGKVVRGIKELKKLFSSR